MVSEIGRRVVKHWTACNVHTITRMVEEGVGENSIMSCVYCSRVQLRSSSNLFLTGELILYDRRAAAVSLASTLPTASSPQSILSSSCLVFVVLLDEHRSRKKYTAAPNVAPVEKLSASPPSNGIGSRSLYCGGHQYRPTYLLLLLPLCCSSLSSLR